MNLIEKAQKQTQAVYLACDEKIADDISNTITKLLSALEIANEALKFYAAHDGNEFKTRWLSHVCDSWSGLTTTFVDWDGALQDEPYEFARSAQEKIKLLIEGENI